MILATVVLAALGQGNPLQLGAPTPGLAEQVNVLEVTGATPGERVAFFYAFFPGRNPVHGCPGLRLELQQPIFISLDQADAAGVARIQRQVPHAAHGQVFFFQALEPSSCRVSNRVKFEFH